MANNIKELPYGIGRFSSGWYILIGVLLALIGFGIYAYSQQLSEGLVVTGMRDIGVMGGAAWGLYITFDIYFVGVSFAGITTAAMIRLFNLEQLKPISRIAEALTVVSLIMAGLVIFPDLGQPLRGLVNLFRYARPGSPFFGTFTLVLSGYLFGSLVYLYLDGRRDAAILAKVPGKLQGFYKLWAAGYKDTPAEQERHQKASFWLAIAIVPLLVTAHSSLGFIFGLQVGRPGWYSSLQAPEFVTLAGVSGIGFLIVLTAILRKVLKTEDILTLAVFKWLSDFLMFLLVIYLYFLVVELLTITYIAHSHDIIVANALFTGIYASAYWITVASLVIPLILLAWQFVFKRYQLSWIVISGVLVNIAAVVKRYLIVVPSQTHGATLPYGIGSYSPTWVEYGVVLGIIALGALLYIIFIKVFPIMEVSELVGGGE